MKITFNNIFSVKPVSTLAVAILFLSQFFFSAEADSSIPDFNQEIPTFQLGAGDVIRIFVWNHPNLSMNVPINPNGTINYPLIGELKAAGLTETDFEKIISEKIRKHLKNPLVSVTLTELNSYRVYVNGEVLRSGSFSVKAPLTVTQAIAMAGGFTPFADKSDILIFNPVDGRRIHFDFNDFIRQNPGVRDIFLKTGDTVFVN